MRKSFLEKSLIRSRIKELKLHAKNERQSFKITHVRLKTCPYLFFYIDVEAQSEGNKLVESFQMLMLHFQNVERSDSRALNDV